MTTRTLTPDRARVTDGSESFWHLVHAEWTKFRSVRGWVIAVIVAIMVTTAFVFIATSVSRSCVTTGGGPSVCPAQPTGPGGVPVQDAFYFEHQALTGNGTITVQVTSLTGQVAIGPGTDGQPEMAPGLQPWSKAGLIIKENTTPGSAYAAMMVTGSHGVRMQWDYVNDTPGMTGTVSAASSRWLRLVRKGGTVTGYDSADGTHWALVGTATLPELTSTVQAGLFAAAPSSNGNTTTATGVFGHIRLSWPSTGWTRTNVGGSGAVGQPGSLRQSAGRVSLTGSGDIAPLAGDGNVLSIQRALAGMPIGLIPLIVVAAMFITAEYRRGLIRVSLTAAPRRGRLLAAKAVMVGAVGFATGLIAAAASVAVGTRTLARTDVAVWPVPAVTEARMVIGTAALCAVAAVLALAIGTIQRRSAMAVATAIAVIFLPYLLAVFPPVLAGQGNSMGGLPLAAREWLLRITPPAGFSVQQVLPRFSQVTGAIYPPNDGYYPLAPWTGFGVECAWAVAALALAYYLLRRRDA